MYPGGPSEGLPLFFCWKVDFVNTHKLSWDARSIARKICSKTSQQGNWDVYLRNTFISYLCSEQIYLQILFTEFFSWKEIFCHSVNPLYFRQFFCFQKVFIFLQKISLFPAKKMCISDKKESQTTTFATGGKCITALWATGEKTRSREVA